METITQHTERRWSTTDILLEKPSKEFCKTGILKAGEYNQHIHRCCQTLPGRAYGFYTNDEIEKMMNEMNEEDLQRQTAREEEVIQAKEELREAEKELHLAIEGLKMAEEDLHSTKEGIQWAEEELRLAREEFREAEECTPKDLNNFWW